MTHFPPTPSPGLVTVSSTGAIIGQRAYPAAELTGLRGCQIAALERAATLHAQGAGPLMVPCPFTDAVQRVYRLDRLPETDDDAVSSLAVLLTGAHVISMRPAGMDLRPESREERDYLAALRAHWLRFERIPLMEIDAETVAATGGAARHATLVQWLPIATTFYDYGMADEIAEDEETLERRAAICLAEGLDLERVEAGGRSFARRIVGAILGTPATHDGVVL